MRHWRALLSHLLNILYIHQEEPNSHLHHKYSGNSSCNCPCQHLQTRKHKDGGDQVNKPHDDKKYPGHENFGSYWSSSEKKDHWETSANYDKLSAEDIAWIKDEFSWQKPIFPSCRWHDGKGLNEYLHTMTRRLKKSWWENNIWNCDLPSKILLSVVLYSADNVSMTLSQRWIAYGGTSPQDLISDKGDSWKTAWVVNNPGNPRVRQALPVPLPVRTPTRNPRVFPDKTSPRMSKTDKKWPRYAKIDVLAISCPFLIRFECSWARFEGGGYSNSYPYPYPSLPVGLTRTGLKTPDNHYAWVFATAIEESSLGMKNEKKKKSKNVNKNKTYRIIAII